MHVAENKEKLKYAINTGIKRSSAQLFAPSSALASGRFKTQNPALQTGILDPVLAKAAGAKTQSRGTYSPSPPRRRGQEADGLNQVLYPVSPPRRRGSRLDSRLRGNDGRCCLHAFAARLKPGPDTRRFGVRRLAAAFPWQGLPCPDTGRSEAQRAGDRNFLHENEPKVIDNKADHKKRTQERTQF